MNFSRVSVGEALLRSSSYNNNAVPPSGRPTCLFWTQRMFGQTFRLGGGSSSSSCLTGPAFDKVSIALAVYFLLSGRANGGATVLAAG
jgi:hypothetical protein